MENNITSRLPQIHPNVTANKRQITFPLLHNSTESPAGIDPLVS